MARLIRPCAGDRVIVEGVQKVRPGASVKAVPFECGKEARKASRSAPGRKVELTEARDALEILSGSSGLRLGHRHHHHGGGRLAIYNLPISQYPPIAPPSIAIAAFYPGASAETVENSVTQIIEQKMTGFDKMLYMSATSDSSGSSRIELTFAPGTDPDLAWAQVQNKLQLAMASLPEVVGARASRSASPPATT